MSFISRVSKMGDKYRIVTIPKSQWDKFEPGDLVEMVRMKRKSNDKNDSVEKKTNIKCPTCRTKLTITTNIEER